MSQPTLHQVHLQKSEAYPQSSTCFMVGCVRMVTQTPPHTHLHSENDTDEGIFKYSCKMPEPEEVNRVCMLLA